MRGEDGLSFGFGEGDLCGCGWCSRKAAGMLSTDVGRRVKKEPGEGVGVGRKGRARRSCSAPRSTMERGWG